MPLSRRDWHKRYTQQARWTRDLRAYIYPRVGLSKAKSLLDVGCGTGALLGELQSQSQAQVFGLDVRRAHLGLAQINERVLLSQGDAHQLPFPEHTFDITLCHFTLMWLDDPKAALSEMARLTAPNGAVMALAEPDYGGRIDYPPELEQLGKLQLESLQEQGADPFMGRKLAGLFNQTGLKNVETGVLGAQWTGSFSHDDGPLGDGELEEDEVICPRHGARFNVRTGEALTLPAVEDIPAYPVRVRDGMIEVGFLKE